MYIGDVSSVARWGMSGTRCRDRRRMVENEDKSTVAPGASPRFITHVADHRPDVTLRVPPSGHPPTVLDGAQILAKATVPPIDVALVAAVYVPPVRYPHVRMRQDEFVRGGIEGETVRSPPQREYQHRRRRIETVSGGKEVGSRLHHRARWQARRRRRRRRRRSVPPRIPRVVTAVRRAVAVVP